MHKEKEKTLTMQLFNGPSYFPSPTQAQSCGDQFFPGKRFFCLFKGMTNTIYKWEAKGKKGTCVPTTK